MALCASIALTLFSKEVKTVKIGVRKKKTHLKHRLRWPEGNHVDCWSVETRFDVFDCTFGYCTQLKSGWQSNIDHFLYWYVLYICNRRRKKASRIVHFNISLARAQVEIPFWCASYCIFIYPLTSRLKFHTNNKAERSNTEEHKSNENLYSCFYTFSACIKYMYNVLFSA